MNIKNIITVITLHDHERRKIKKQYLLTKNGTIYTSDPELTYIANNIAKEELGYTGKELLENYNKDCLEIFSSKHGIIILDDSILSSVLKNSVLLEG